MKPVIVFTAKRNIRLVNFRLKWVCSFLETNTEGARKMCIHFSGTLSIYWAFPLVHTCESTLFFQNGCLYEEVRHYTVADGESFKHWYICNLDTLL